MNFHSLFLNIISFALSASSGGIGEKYPSGRNTDQAAALQFLQNCNDLLKKHDFEFKLAKWNYNNDPTEANEEAMLKTEQDFDAFAKEAWKNATSFAWKDFKDTNKTAYRMFKWISVRRPPVLSEEKLELMQNSDSDMGEIFANAKVCPYNASSDEKCDLSVGPEELTKIFRNSRNNLELTHFWSEWHDATGKKMRDSFIQFVELANEDAELQGYSDMGAMMREGYESEDFEEDVERLWLTIKPFYEQLHAYVRQKLRKQYPISGIKTDGPIPAHLLGDIYGLTWHNIFDIVSPYPGKESTDVTEMMKKKNMTPLEMFKISEDFYTSLGLMEMPPEFWRLSRFVKPNDTETNCHPYAEDFGDGKHVRIEMCTEVDIDSLMMVHHEMGHVEYALYYARQPAIFQDSANPGFDEAVGDTIFLSARTPQHLKKIGLLEEIIDDREVDINTLLRTALDQIAFAPFAYLNDAWRWKVYDGSINKEELNQKWWEMKLQNQGLCPPVRRTNEHLDPMGFKFLADNSPYIGYFVAVVIQHQFHKALCDAADHQGPLHKCDIYNSKRAGKRLSDMLSKGSSEHWEEAMSAITNGKSRKMDATPMIEYFTPLIDWLKEQNKNETVGWKSSDPMICP